jgi:alkylhydroperoxidase family enzyme
MWCPDKVWPEDLESKEPTRYVRGNLYDGALARIAELEAALADPNAVHANMLSGRIAKPRWQQIKHLYPVEIAKLEAALRSIAANTCCDKCQEAALVARAALGREG